MMWPGAEICRAHACAITLANLSLWPRFCIHQSTTGVDNEQQANYYEDREFLFCYVVFLWWVLLLSLRQF